MCHAARSSTSSHPAYEIMRALGVTLRPWSSTARCPLEEVPRTDKILRTILMCRIAEDGECDGALEICACTLRKALTMQALRSTKLLEPARASVPPGTRVFVN